MSSPRMQEQLSKQYPGVDVPAVCKVKQGEAP
jgi:hypothetical protein